MVTITHNANKNDNEESSADSIQSNNSSQTSNSSHIENQQASLLASAARNRCVSCCILLLSLSGLTCSIVSTLSCQWFAWTPLDDEMTYGIFEADEAANQAESVGLFRFYPFDSVSSISASSHEDFVQCEWYSDETGRAPSLVTLKTDSWIFTAQVCWIIATVIALLSCMGTIIQLCRPVEFRIPILPTTGWLFASGIQGASCIAATALCGGDDFWSCPWLQGAHASAGSAWLYLICWLLSMCGFRIVDLHRQTHLYVDHQHHHLYRGGNTKGSYTTSTSSVISEIPTSERDGPKVVTAEELLGTDDPVIHRAVGQQAKAIQEFISTKPMPSIDENDTYEEMMMGDDGFHDVDLEQ